MKELFDLMKMLLSRDFIEVVSRAIKRLNSRKAWQDDLVIYKGSFNEACEYKSQALIGQATRLMLEKKWSEEEARTTKYTVYELIRNAFEHSGAKRPLVCVELEISSDYIRTTVSDNGNGFNLRAELEAQDALNELTKKSRALGVIYRMNTSLQTNPPKHNSITATLTKGYRPCRKYKTHNATVYELNSRVSHDELYWVGFVSHLKQQKIEDNIVIHFNYDFPSSDLSVINDSVQSEFSTRNPVLGGRETNHCNVIVCLSNYALSELEWHLKSYYIVVRSIDEAIDYFNDEVTKVPQPPITLASDYDLELPPPPPDINVVL